ncbi:unnamed protein product [Adineta ricciae]|uniref:Uncharacterized protein n=1 Tax=Adineta ricciae TaxID=249248 RepID=A0A814NT11_ADIRI|nr:unnamed protein product [Adineta ricciae]
MDHRFEYCIDSITLNGDPQPTSYADETGSDDFDIDKFISSYSGFPDLSYNNTSTDLQLNGDIDQASINALIDPASDPPSMNTVETQSLQTSTSGNDFFDILDACINDDQFQQNLRFEQTDAAEILASQPASVVVGSSPVEAKENNNSYNAQAFLDQQDDIYRTVASSQKKKNRQPSTTTSAGPIDDYLDYSGCQPCASAQVYNDYVYQQQTIEYDTYETKKIRIMAQPRQKYRPRTQNESRNSSHYVRCEEGVTPEYPTIAIPSEWNFQADVNFIEIAWVGIDKEMHPYTLYNKNSLPTLEDHVMIFKQHEPNILYFRLTNEDFRNGYKTFMLELIKSKQDEVITKELIKTRQLDQSMLRFTRVFQLGKGDYQRDEGSVEYSSIMMEAYGDVDIEHMGPRCGPMKGQEMLYMVFKGRLSKADLKIEVNEPVTGWRYVVTSFTKNGNVVYFLMPAFPHPQFDTIRANIVVFCKDEELTQSIYLYKKSLDEEFAELRLNDLSPTTTDESSSSSLSSSLPNSFNAFDFLTGTGILANTATRKSPTTKRTTKRLNRFQSTSKITTMHQREYRIIDRTAIDTDQQLQSSLLPVGPNALITPVKVNSDPQEHFSRLFSSDERNDINSMIDTTHSSDLHFHGISVDEEHNNLLSTSQNDQSSSRLSQTITIKSQPRSTYRPRTEKEMEQTLCYIQSKEDSSDKYPSIYVDRQWQQESAENIIEVAHIDIEEELHPYPIRNSGDTSRNWSDRNTSSSVLYFHVTPEDFDKGSKMFRIAIVKLKLSEVITKELVRDRQLEKSMFRFTRIYLDENHTYQRDETSSIITCTMAEKYGNISVAYISHQYGPMSGNQLVHVVFKSLKTQDRKLLSFKIVVDKHGLTHDIETFVTKGNLVHFLTPALPSILFEPVEARIVVSYKGNTIYEAPYVYDVNIDLLVSRYELKMSVSADTDQPHSCDSSLPVPILAVSSTTSNIERRPSMKRQRTI